VSKDDIIGRDRVGCQIAARLRGRPSTRRLRAGPASLWLAALLAVVLLIGAGKAYRAASSGLQAIKNNPIALDVPLSRIPMQIEGWTGRDVPVEATTEEYMLTNFADEYINRRYVNADGTPVELYVVYCSSYPSGLLGHQPDVCYVSAGYVHDLTTATEIATRSGTKVPCLMHQFHKSSPFYTQVSVLSFYVLNGEITVRERDFSGLFDRFPNISGNRARYVAQVQISSGFDRATQLAAADLVDTILTFLPDQHDRAASAQSPARLGSKDNH
jgi:hypothetical protein